MPFPFVVIVKPHAVRDSLQGCIRILLQRYFLQQGMNVTLRRMGTFTPKLELCQKHYAEHAKRDFFERITQALAQSDVACYYYEASTAAELANVRQFCVATLRPLLKLPDAPSQDNVVHCSDSVEAGARETGVWSDPNLTSPGTFATFC